MIQLLTDHLGEIIVATAAAVARAIEKRRMKKAHAKALEEAATGRK